jgi:hypothetical protein
MKLCKSLLLTSVISSRMILFIEVDFVRKCILDIHGMNHLMALDKGIVCYVLQRYKDTYSSFLINQRAIFSKVTMR